MSTYQPPASEGRLDHALSARVAERVSAQPKDCYRNAVMALMVDPEAETLPGLRYVEGWALYHDTGLPVQHGWLAYDAADGPAVVDPTAVVVAGPAAAVSYYVGRAWTSAELHAGLWKRALPLHPALFGYGDPAMLAAHDRAWSAASGQDFGALMARLRRPPAVEGDAEE